MDSDRELVLRRIAAWARRQRQETFQRTCGCSARDLPGEQVVDGLWTASSAALGLIGPEASQEEALDAFNAFVRSEGAKSMARCLGTSVLPYRDLLAVLSSFMWHSLDHISANFAIGRYSASDVMVELIETASVSFIFIPLGLLLAALALSLFPRMSKRLSLCYCILVSGISMAAYVGAQASLDFLGDAIREKDNLDASWWYLWTYVVIDGAGLLLLFLIHVHESVEMHGQEQQPQAKGHNENKTEESKGDVADLAVSEDTIAIPTWPATSTMPGVDARPDPDDACAMLASTGKTILTSRSPLQYRAKHQNPSRCR